MDRGALDAAMELGLPTDGYCPRGRKAEDGVIPDKYRMREMSSSDYRDRTRMNVLRGDATLILYRGRVSGGTALTADLATSLGRRWLPIEINLVVDREDLDFFLNGVTVLNVAGPRESKCPGIQEQAKKFLLGILF